MTISEARVFGRLKILDSIRGIAALVVLYHHIFKLNTETFKGFLSSDMYEIFHFISDLNHEAVLLFFIISGFSIGLSTFKRPLTNKTTVNGYLYRRFKRILPIYWMAILLSLSVGIVLNITYLDDFSVRNFLGNLLFLQTSSSIPESWVVPYGLNGPLWSLSFEMFFYLLFPLVYFINQKYLSRTGLFIKYMGLVCIVLVGIVINKKIVFLPYFLFMAGFITWILGYISAQYFTFWKKNNLFFLANLVLGLTVTMLSSQIPSDTIKVIAKGMLLNGLFYFAMLILDRVYIKKLGSIINALFYKIGEGSYAIYALHYPILIFFQTKGISLGYQLVFIPFFIVGCYFLEKRSIQWKMGFLETDYLKPINFLRKRGLIKV